MSKTESYKESTDRFEKWVVSMTDKEFEMWYEQDATYGQKKLADKIRESEEEE